MAWLPDGEKILKISLFVLTQLTNVTDTQTDRRTDTAWQHRPRLCIASRGKNDVPLPVLYRENWPKSTAVITGVIFTCPSQAGLVFSPDHRRSRLFCIGMLNDNRIIDYKNLFSFSFLFLHYGFLKCAREYWIDCSRKRGAARVLIACW